MRLALACGRLDWRALIDELTVEQFDEWLAFNSLEPIGGERMTWTLANGFAAICGAFTRSTSDTVEPWQFVPGAVEPRQQPTSPGAVKSMLGVLKRG